MLKMQFSVESVSRLPGIRTHLLGGGLNWIVGGLIEETAGDHGFLNAQVFAIRS
jgi:hypothetical protein